MLIDLQIEREMTRILYHEAELLDNHRLMEWLDMMTDDVVYRMPVILNREMGHGDEASFEMEHYSENRHTMELRIRRLGTTYAWAETPPSRTRHMITNIRIALKGETELAVDSYFMLSRNRGQSPEYEFMAGERKDIWRRTGSGWKLAERVVYVDQALLGIKNLSVFL